MDRVLKLSQQFFKQYKDLKKSRKDINEMNKTDLYNDLRLSIDNLDCDKILKIQDHIQFPSNLKLGYSKLHEEEGINVGLFFISKFNIMPMHDHPDMFVFTKPVYGKAKKVYLTIPNEKDRKKQFEYPINYYFNDKFDQSKEEYVHAQMTEMHLSEKGDPTQVIEPIKNNLHEIIAVENYAFLDVLIPDYDLMNAQRFCNFYNLKQIVDHQQNIYSLQITSFPDDYDIQEVQSPLISKNNS